MLLHPYQLFQNRVDNMLETLVGDLTYCFQSYYFPVTKSLARKVGRAYQKTLAQAYNK